VGRQTFLVQLIPLWMWTGVCRLQCESKKIPPEVVWIFIFFTNG